MAIVLASGSPRRQELLRRIGIHDFTCCVSHADESYPDTLSPCGIVEHISRKKSLAADCAAEDVVITADTMVFLADRRLGKPHSEQEAFSMLAALQGKRHTVCTGVTLRQGARLLTRSVSTDVWFRPLTEREIRAYIASGEPMDKAGAYGIQGLGSLLVERIDGDFFNVMGLPLVLLNEMLAAFGVNLL